MVSDARIAANRANARKSTGPKTQAGKAASRRNALRHGLAAEHVLTFDEDAEDFARFAGEMRGSLAPAGEAEMSLCDRIVMGTWRLRRVWRQEAAALNKTALGAAHERVREDLYEEVLAELQKHPPSEEELKKIWPPYDARGEARRIVWGMSDAKLEEAALAARAEERAAAAAAGEGAADTEEDARLASIGQKPDTPMWPEHEMAALSRYEASIERALHRASLALEKLQARRREMEDRPLGAVRPTSPSRRSASGPSLSARGGGEGRGEVGDAAAAPLSRQQRRAAERTLGRSFRAPQKSESTERTQARPGSTPSAARANGSPPA
jgi:hypothetical protein